MPETTHFGFRTVAAEEKATLVRGVFDRVASRYDLMNDLMSAGLHRLWKKEMVAWLHPRAGMHVLDVAGGTGDIAFRIADAARRDAQSADIDVTVCDINWHMLGEGRSRAIDQNRLQGLEWVCGNAESLPFPDAHFDAYTIAFGIRNVTDIPAALREAARVLKPGGRFLCLEFSHMTSELLQKAYDAYSFSLIPRIGEWVTGSGDPYQYLVESIRQFPRQDAFAKMIGDAGLGNVQYRNLAQGVVAIHSARKF